MVRGGTTIEEGVLLALRRIARAASVHSRHIQQTYGLTSPQLFLLRELARREEATGGELAKAASLSHATVTGVIDRLERRGLLSRQRSERDKRRIFARITEAGRALLDAAPPPLQFRFLHEFRKLRDWEQSLLVASLQRVAGMMESAEEQRAVPESEIAGDTALEPLGLDSGGVARTAGGGTEPERE
jgi:DNA-binding MarR family transcriptional regulator